MPIITGKRIKEVYVLNRKLVPENIDLDENRQYDLTVSDKNYISINEVDTYDLVYYCKFQVKKADDNLDSNNLNDWKNE